jgi:Transposase
MPYNIAGIDVHKRMLHVVVSDVEVDGEYEFTRRIFGSYPEGLRSLAAWLVEQQVEEVVMESTAQYWKPVWGMLERYWKPICRGRKDALVTSGTLHLAQALSNRGRRGRKKDFLDAERLVKRLVANETDSELCARCRAAPVADGHAYQAPANAQPSAAAESIGGSAGRSAYQVI